jgi:catechol 2,3-dioxygenase-like lactoylglutathione lyase family enzyme
MQPSISLVTLGVADVARTRRFYEQLGWRASSASTAGVAFFQLGGTVLAVWSRAALAEDAGLPDASGGGSGGFGGFALAHNVASKEVVDRTLAEAQAAGGRLLKPARDVFWGGYSGYFADPDGHPWEVAWHPHWPLRADGTLVLPE